MKLSPILSGFLESKGQLALKGIGTIYKNRPSDEAQLPEVEGLYFRFDKNTALDETLVIYASEAAGKMKSLAKSDLESYFENGKQLLNIGKPLVIEGVASIIKLQNGTYSLHENLSLQIQGQDESRKMRTPAGHSEIDYNSSQYNLKEKAGFSITRTLLIAGGLIVISLIGWGIYKIINAENKPVTSETSLTTDTDSTISPESAPVIPQADSTAAAPVQVPDTPARAYYTLVLQDTANKAYALKRFAILKASGHPVFLETADSIRFAIVYHFPPPFSDSVSVRDSIERYFKRKGLIIK